MATEVGLLDNLRTIMAAIRRAGIRVFIVPHHRWEPGDYETWDHPTPYQVSAGKAQVFAKDVSETNRRSKERPLSVAPDR